MGSSGQRLHQRLRLGLALAKPHIAMMSLASGVWGGVLAPGTLWGARQLGALAGLGLLVGGANALNMVLEVEPDGRMHRTRQRPLPSGRMQRSTAAALGGGAALLGLLALGFLAQALAALLGLAALVIYLAIYTPMKKVSSLALIPGAVAGALPVPIGWLISAGQLQLEVLYPFGILTLWQVPHFAAIALLLREDYARGGFRTLPQAVGPQATAAVMVAGSAVLLAFSLLPSLLGYAHLAYTVPALILGSALFWASLIAQQRPARLRLLFRGTLIYLPLVAIFLMLGRW